jgi:hypothetical protein
MVPLTPGAEIVCMASLDRRTAVVAMTPMMSLLRIADVISSLFFSAMVHADDIVSVAGVARMSFQAGSLEISARLAAARLLGSCRSVHAE